jgi:hypothetical protein
MLEEEANEQIDETSCMETDERESPLEEVEVDLVVSDSESESRLAAAVVETPIPKPNPNADTNTESAAELPVPLEAENTAHDVEDPAGPEAEPEAQPGQYYWRYELKLTSEFQPSCLAVSDETEFQKCFLKGCKW